MSGLKRLLCAALCLLLCAVTVMPTSAGAKPRFGDANDDGAVNMKDILVLRSYLAGTAAELNTVYADADASGMINMKDVLLVRKYVAGLPVTFGGEGEALDLPVSEGKDVSLSLYDVKPEGEFGYELWIGAENKTADREIEVTLLGVSINDVMSMPLWSKVLTPGDGEVTAITPSFELFGGLADEEVEKIGFLLVAIDAETGEWVDAGEQPCVLFVGDEITYQKADRTPENGLTLLDNSEICIVATALSEDGWFPTLELYMENRTDQPLLYVCDGAEIDGEPTDALWLSVMLPGTNTNAGMLLSLSETALDLSAVKTIRFSVDAYTIDSLNEENPFPLHSYNVTYTAQ